MVEVEALDRAVRRAQELGVDLLAEPQRAAAVVADLVGDPTRSSAAEVAALHGILTELSTRGAGPGAEVAVDWRSTLEAHHDLATLDRVWHPVSEALELRVAEPAGRPRWVLPAGGAAAAAVLVGGVLLLGPVVDGATPSPEPTPDGDGSETTPADDDPTPEPTEGVASQQRLFAYFAPVREGGFDVERGWTITEGGDFIGLVRITVPDGGDATGLHREVVPPDVLAGGVTPTWEPRPASVVGPVANFPNIQLQGDQVLELRYVVPLPDGAIVDDPTLLGWYETWAEVAAEYRPVFGDTEPLVQPDITDAER